MQAIHWGSSPGQFGKTDGRWERPLLPSKFGNPFLFCSHYCRHPVPGVGPHARRCCHMRTRRHERRHVGRPFPSSLVAWPWRCRFPLAPGQIYRDHFLACTIRFPGNFQDICFSLVTPILFLQCALRPRKNLETSTLRPGPQAPQAPTAPSSVTFQSIASAFVRATSNASS